MDTITLWIDGTEIQTTYGTSVLSAALAANLYIPHLCTHSDLPVQSSCKLCVVEVEGIDGPVCSCDLTAENGMHVTTESELLRRIRIMALELMLASHPKDCTSCKRYLHCELQALIQYLGVAHARMHTITRTTNAINIRNPIIVREMERCIQCGRCVRVCRDVRGADILGYGNKNGETYIRTANDLPLADAGCRFCSACVAVCPTGALTDEPGIFRTDLPEQQALIPCEAECPAHIDVPAYIRAVQKGALSDAAGIIREKVPFPHALGHVCNHRCETACKRGHLNSALSICSLKQFVAEEDHEQRWEASWQKTAPRTGKKVAVIGSGVCGLTAAYYLNKKGHDVTVYEANPLPGGQMTTGIPAWRLPPEDVKKEIQMILDCGITVQCNTRIDNVIVLKNQFDAVLAAVGTTVGRKLTTLPGSELPEVFSAMEVLRASRLDESLPVGETICIIGGGNVAVDVAGTLLRQGKTPVLVCLEKGASQADPEERDHILEEGAVLYDSCSAEAILEKNGHVSGLRFHRISDFSFDPVTRAVKETLVPDSTDVLSCDTIIFAAGQDTGLSEAFGLALNRFGYPIEPETGKSGYRTSVKGVFAAGDMITGTRFLIDAIAGGRIVAGLMDSYLGGDGKISNVLIPRKREPRLPLYNCNDILFAMLPREVPAVRPAEKRKADYMPVSVAFSGQEAQRESLRCLQCDLRCDLNKQKLWTQYE